MRCAPPDGEGPHRRSDAVYRRGVDDFLLLTEAELGERVRATLCGPRFAAKGEVELEEHASASSSAGDTGRNHEPRARRAAFEVIDEEPGWREIDEEELELMRIRAATPRFGRELDDRVLPAEAGLDARAIDFEKGCYPGQEPIARQHYRGRVNRTLRVLELEGEELPEYDAELDARRQGRRTRDECDSDGEQVVALAYVRVEVPATPYSASGPLVAQLDLPSPRP